MVSWRDVIINWDAKKTDALQKVYQQNSASDSFWKELIDLLKQEEAHRAGSWLVKHHYDQKLDLPEAMKLSWLLSVVTFNHWEAILHAYQIMQYFAVAEELADTLYPQIQDS
jgi:hypothetical protein